MGLHVVHNFQCLIVKEILDIGELEIKEMIGLSTRPRLQHQTTCLSA
jgi:hypothetical protein